MQSEIEANFSARARVKIYFMLTYVKESWEELKNNVTWLSREQASSLMVIVAVFSILFALATWGVDSVFSKLIKLYFDNLIG